MKLKNKLLFPLIITLLSISGIVFAAAAVDFPNYYPPANVDYTSANTGQSMVLYFEQGASPLARVDSPPASGNLNTLSWTAGGFQTSSSTLGAYQLVQPNLVDCNSKSYTACAAANTGIPGSQESDFSIISPTSTPTSTISTSTLSASDMVLTYLFYILDAVWFIACVGLFLIGLKWVYNTK